MSNLFGRSSYGGGGGGMRIVIALVIAGIALVGYFAKTQVNPVTGEKQRVAMNVDQEMALGLEAAPKMASEMGGALDPKSDRDAARVADVGRRLAYDTPQASKDPYAQSKNYHFYLLNDPQTVNAFALPGGQIFITRALFDKLENEAQLAGVLGHEIGHVINRHSAEHMARGQLGGALATAVGVGASDGSGKGQMAAMAAQMANQMLQHKYSRGDELESDAYGIDLMTQLGYDPQEMLGVMAILMAASGGGGRGPSVLATHPDPDARIARINEILAKYQADYARMRLTKGPPLR
jgi:predicted Zn-dependent protease